VKLTPDMQRVVLEQRLGFVATVGADGRPNLSPKGTTTVFDDEHLMFADVFSPQTVANIATNPNVEINVVDPIIRKGYRFRGTATAHTDGPTYEQGLAVLRSHGSTLTSERVRTIVVIEVTDAAALVSPAYADGATESEVAQRWRDHHLGLL
jgi:predicted pyridoxine 5'-phosphate oxidase superfamily flavin-nucleotide-binding protein